MALKLETTHLQNVKFYASEDLTCVKICDTELCKAKQSHCMFPGSAGCLNDEHFCCISMQITRPGGEDEEVRDVWLLSGGG